MVNQGCTTTFPTVRFDILEFCHFLEILRAVTRDNKVQIKEEEWPHADTALTILKFIFINDTLCIVL